MAEDNEEQAEAHLNQILAELRQQNRVAIVELQREGAQINPAALLEVRLQALLSLLTETDKKYFDVAFEQRLNEFLESAKADVARAKLTAQPSPQKLFIPGT